MSFNDDFASFNNIFFDTDCMPAINASYRNEDRTIDVDFTCQFFENQSQKLQSIDAIDTAIVVFDENQTFTWKVNDFIVVDNVEWRIEEQLEKEIGVVTLQLRKGETSIFK